MPSIIRLITPKYAGLMKWQGIAIA